MNKHGGKRKGAGRKPSPYNLILVKLPFADDEEYKAYMSIPPRKRVELALKEYRNQVNKLCIEQQEVMNHE